MTDQRPELRPLTAFRFFAALAVFFRHVCPWLGDHPDVPPVVYRVMNDGFCGVTFFFVLSGFILTYNYRAAFARLSAPAVGTFYAARVARIWPVHLLTFALAAVVLHREIAAAPAWYAGPAVANLALVQSWFPHETIYYSFNSVSWSLSDEVFFYALFPAALWAMRRVGLDRPRPAAALAVGVWAAAAAGVLSGRGHPLGFWVWSVDPAFCFVDFLIGVALGQVFLGLRDRGSRGPSSRGATALEVGSLMLVAAALAAGADVPYLFRRSVYYTPVFAAVILAFAYQRGLVSRLLSGPAFRLLGEVSFSFYMLHYLLIRLIDRYPHATHVGDWDAVPRSLAVFAVSLAASVGCYRLFELPARNRVRAWLVRPPATRPAGERPADVVRDGRPVPVGPTPHRAAA
jgi:peptidoglycan/LPS O-acetylase OafA/YrhL